jgi:hypothetical protein
VSRGGSPRALRRAADPPTGAHPGLSAGAWLLLGAAFLGVALTLYGPALEGPFLSDDVHYVRDNPFVHELSAENLVILFDPTGPATIHVVNYSPLQLLLHALAWQAFGAETFGHHVLNVALHALASVLLVALFLATGLPRPGALLGGLLFLVHPANVEAVAWISQLKSTLALVLSLCALLAHARRPALGFACFVAALLAKPTAAFALPVAALLDWTGPGRIRWRWLSLWALVFVGHAYAEFATHQRSGAAEAELHRTPWVLLRTIGALGMRYLVMAVSSYGVSAFHDPEPARSALDPWWLASLPCLALLLARSVVVARRRDVEIAYWTWAAVSFAPVSQVFPFLYPMADRYLYFILPGLLGGGLLAARDGLESLPSGLVRRRPQLGRAALVAGLVVTSLFALHAHRRAAIWRSSATLFADAAAHYPDGVPGNLQRARRAMLMGDAAGALEALGRAAERGFNRFQQLETDPIWAPLRQDPGFRRLVEQMAGRWIERGRRKQSPTQIELRAIAHAHLARREYADALRVMEAALATGGPRDAELRAEIEALRAALEAGAPERVRLGPSLNALP